MNTQETFLLFARTLIHLVDMSQGPMTRSGRSPLRTLPSPRRTGRTASKPAAKKPAPQRVVPAAGGHAKCWGCSSRPQFDGIMPCSSCLYANFAVIPCPGHLLEWYTCVMCQPTVRLWLCRRQAVWQRGHQPQRRHRAGARAAEVAQAGGSAAAGHAQASVVVHKAEYLMSTNTLLHFRCQTSASAAAGLWAPTWLCRYHSHSVQRQNGSVSCCRSPSADDPVCERFAGRSQGGSMRATCSRTASPRASTSAPPCSWTSWCACNIEMLLLQGVRSLLLPCRRLQCRVASRHPASPFLHRRQS